MRLSDLQKRVLAQPEQLDPDALAFLTAAGITDATIKNAINNLVLGLKNNNIWSKLKAIYPIVGGTSTTHKFNLKDPRDLDVAFRLQFFGTITHSSNGMQGVTSGYANTFFAPIELGLNNLHLSFYSRTDNNSGSDMGVQNENDPQFYSYIATRTANASFLLINQNTITSVINNNGTGYYIANRTAGNVKNGWKNGIKVENVTTISNGRTLRPIFILAFNRFGTPSDFSLKQCAFSTIGEGLTDTEAVNLYNIVQSFQTTLGRQV
jgi:hypothetical protein